MLVGLDLALSLNLATEKVLVQWDANVLLLQLLIIQQKVATYISEKAALLCLRRAEAPLAEHRLPANPDRYLPALLRY